MLSPEPSISPPEGAYEDLARNLLFCFMETYGEGCQQRFEQDLVFRELLWAQCMHTLGLVAAIMSWRSESFPTQGIAADAIADAKHDIPEVAALRIFTFQNMVPKDAMERPEASTRIHWFLTEYRKSRGGLGTVAGH